MVQRLPIVNQDDGTWGGLLRNYLLKEHTDTGTDNAANGGHQHITITASDGTAGTAPITLTSGPLLSTPAIGTIEFNTDKLYFTKTTGTTRQTIAAYNTSGSTGDIYYRDSGANFTALGIGGTGNVLTVSGGLPAWSSTVSSATLSSSTIDNSNTITVKDANLTIQNSTTTTKQAKFDLSGLTATTRTYSLPDASTTLVGTEVQRAGNWIVAGDFEDDSQWKNAFGAQSTAQAYGGTKSRIITASGAGKTVDRLVVTHDATGNPAKLITDAYRWWAMSVYIRKDAANTGTANPAVYVDAVQYDQSGAESPIYYSSYVTGIAESTLSSSGWTNFNNMFLTGGNITGVSFVVSIDAATPSGNKYYIDHVVLQEISAVVNLSMTMSNKTLDDSTVATIKDSNFTIENSTTTTKTAKFDASALTASTPRTYTLPDASGTIALTKPRSTSTNAPGATPTWNTNNYDVWQFTGINAAITSMTTNFTSTSPAVGQKMMVSFKDDGVSARAITWGASFQNSGVAALLSTTVLGKTHWVALMYDGTKWICMACDSNGY